MTKEVDPKPTRAALEILKKLLEGVENQEEYFVLRETLHDVYKAVSTQDSDLIQGLSFLQEKGKIFSEEKLYIFVLFQVARIAGPYNLKEIRDIFVEENVERTTILQKLDHILMDATIKNFLKRVIERM